MTLRYDDLRFFIIRIRGLGYLENVSNNILETEIAKTFGISPYIMGNIKKQLVKFGFISGDGVVWNIKYGKEETKQEAEKKIEKELDNYEYSE